MMTDEQLLRLAAKAVGYDHLTEWAEITDCDSNHYMHWALYAPGDSGQCDSWNPLVPGVDALRLMADLKLTVEYTDGIGLKQCAFVKDSYSDEDLCYVDLEDHSDATVATCRAIVRAAAEIGLQRFQTAV